MFNRTKILWAAGGIGVVGFLFLLWWGGRTIVDLSQQTANLTKDLEAAKIALDSEVTRSKAVEDAITRLEKQDYERRSQLRGFEGRLSQISRQSAETRELLHMVVPGDLLHGLRAFPPVDSSESVSGS